MCAMPFGPDTYPRLQDKNVATYSATVAQLDSTFYIR